MLKITSKQFEVTAPIRERVEGRFEKLDRHNVQLINPHVIISQEKALFKIEASVGIPQGDLFAQAKHENLYTAITAMGQKLEKQLNRLVHKPEAKRGDIPELSAESNIDVEDEDLEAQYAA